MVYTHVLNRGGRAVQPIKLEAAYGVAMVQVLFFPDRPR